MKFEDVFAGMSSQLEHTVTEEDVKSFTALSHDVNRVHAGPAGIVHGAFLSALVSRLLGTQLPGDGAIWLSSDIRFLRPVRVNDALKLHGLIVKKFEDSRQLKIYVDVYNQAGHLCVTATNWIKIED